MGHPIKLRSRVPVSMLVVKLVKKEKRTRHFEDDYGSIVGQAENVEAETD